MARRRRFLMTAWARWGCLCSTLFAFTAQGCFDFGEDSGTGGASAGGTGAAPSGGGGTSGAGGATGGTSAVGGTSGTTAGGGTGGTSGTGATGGAPIGGGGAPSGGGGTGGAPGGTGGTGGATGGTGGATGGAGGATGGTGGTGGSCCGAACSQQECVTLCTSKGYPAALFCASQSDCSNNAANCAIKLSINCPTCNIFQGYYEASCPSNNCCDCGKP